ALVAGRPPRRPPDLGRVAARARSLPAEGAPVTFQWPFLLVLLALVPLLAIAHVLRERRRSSYAAEFVNPALLPNLVDRSPGFRRHLPIAVLLAGLAALIVGLARPHA